MSSRLIAIQIINQVVEKNTPLKIAIENNRQLKKAGKNKAFIQEMLFGTLRWYIQFEYILDQLIGKGIKKKDRLLKYLIMIGFYQLEHMRIPSHAAVSETVEICNKLNMKWAKGLVNAILRKYLRERKELYSSLKKNEIISKSHPKWLIEEIKKDWPKNWNNILIANNKYPPMYIRVNKLRNNRKDYLTKLKNADITVEKTNYSPCGILLKKPLKIEKLPGFFDGDVSVQELAAQLAAELLELKPGQNVLDACAAPGGKSSHILETEPKIKTLTLVEKDKKRAEKLYKTLERLKLKANVKINDVTDIDKWWDGEKFDRILIDAPCSATGIIRRQPDIKILRTIDEIKTIRKLQMKILNILWHTLRKDGLILYVTCSVLKQENSKLIKKFIDKNSGCRLKPIVAEWGFDTGYGRQILSGQDNMDGFFYALLKKESNVC